MAVEVQRSGFAGAESDTISNAMIVHAKARFAERKLPALVRLWLLDYLHDANGYTANDLVLLSFLEYLATPMSRDVLRNELRWLENCGLIERWDIPEMEMFGVKLTAKGADVACGTIIFDGVARPEP